MRLIGASSRNDLVALVIDGHRLGDGLVWESGTGTQEFFPHLYGAFEPEAVVAVTDFAPGADGSFLRSIELDHAVGAAA